VKVLLDTHIWIWAIGAPQRLSREVSRTLQNSSTQVWLSAISLWELSILANKGRVNLRMDVDEWISRAFNILPVEEAAITNAVVRAANKFRLPTDDPADAFIAATASVFELTLVTADEKLLAFKHISTLAND